MKKMSVLKRGMALLLALVLILGCLPANHVHAASNVDGGLEGQTADVFTALGFDTSVMPEGYDAESVDNPYGRTKVTGTQTWEALVSTQSGVKANGSGNNGLSASDVVNAGVSGSNPLMQFAVAAADFDNDGLAGEAVYVGFDSVLNIESYGGTLRMHIYDGKTGQFSDALSLGYVSKGYMSGYNSSWDTTDEYVYSYAAQNMLKVTAGDYDGDGTYEIAVYIGASGNARVDIYKWMQDENSAADAWKDLNNWSVVWSYVISNNSTPNMVSLHSADINQDGIDDLCLSYGEVRDNIDYYQGGLHYTNNDTATKSTALIMWGDRNNMLQNRYDLNLEAAGLGELARVSITTGDLDGDGYNELVVTGQSLSDVFRNTSRSIILYMNDGSGGLVKTYSETYDIVSGYYESGEWVSNNGFDDNYRSEVYMTTNAAVFTPEGYDYGFVYLDSCLYEYTEGVLRLKMCLDDTNYDGTNTLDNTWLSSDYYVEFGAVAMDINGEGYQQLFTSYYTADSCGHSESISGALPTVVYDFEGGFGGLQGSDGKLLATTKSDTCYLEPEYHGVMDGWDQPEKTCCYYVEAVNCDSDTIILEYTGNHTLSYQDPKVLAIIAAAPYFEDVDVISDYDYAWQNTTSWSKTEGGGEGTTVQVDLEAGGYVSQGSKFNELEVAALFTMEWAEETTEITEYTLTFETSQDEDAVAFFTIPTEHYEYAIYRPNENGEYVKDPEPYVISRPFQAVYQVLNLDYYESIRGDHSSLPAIRGEILTSTPGDPASYPASTAGYDVIAQWNDKPAGVSFGNGAITQEITITKEESESYNLGAAVDVTAGGGYDGETVSVMAGITFSLNPSGGWMTYDISGTTISGTVTNMPLEFQDYGYYYDWALFSYAAKVGGSTVPVVSYVVNSVSEPPQLPDDFQQDVERTTADKNVLTWSYDGEYSKFIIYKYYDFPVGGGLQEVAKYAAGETPYTLKYDAEGNPYKEFYFEDTNLAPYSEHQYAIQVERLKEIPPLSAPSALLTARTKAASGNPVLTIVESDGTNDGSAKVYPDKNSYLIAQVTGPDGEQGSSYYSTIQYQWQKRNDQGKWVDLTNETNQTLTIASAGSDTTGVYRCRVNVVTNTDNTAISAYTGSAELVHSKRTSVIQTAYAMDIAGKVKVYAQVINAHTDSATPPDGYVTFNFVNTATGASYPVNVPLDSAGVANVVSNNSLPAGQYRVYVTYSGSSTFKSCTTEIYYLAELDAGYALEGLETVTYGEGTEITFNEVVMRDGIADTEYVDANNIILAGGDTVTVSKSSGWITTTVGGTPSVSGYTLVQPGDSMIQGGKYLVKFLSNRTSADESDPNRYDWYLKFTPDFSGMLERADWSNPNVRVFIKPDTGYLSRYDTGMYKIAENTPAGNYTVVARSASGSVVSKNITINPRPITLQLPTKVEKQNSDGTMGDIIFGELTVASGSWAACDTGEDGNVTGTIASTSVNPSYTNTAGTVYDKDSSLGTCGYYTITAAASLDNYKVAFLPGSLSVIGGNKPITFGVRPFEGDDVGTLYMVSPDYAYTREELGLTLQEAVGSRIVFTAVPDEGYQVYDWYVDGVAQGVTDTSFAHVMLNQDTKVEVQFVFKPDNLVFGISGATEGGTLTCSDSSLTSGSILIPNSYVTFTAQAMEGYHFKEWRYTELGNGTAYYTEDDGSMSSTFELLMPKVSCSLYAVFERDGYTLTYTDKAGIDGLTAWYWGNATGDTTAQLQKITVASGDSVPGDTQIVVQAKEGYALNSDYNFVATGSQGQADYDEGTYTLTLTEDTDITGYTVQNSFNVTVDFDIAKTYAFCEGAQVTLTVDGTEYVYDCPEGDETYSVSEIPGGSKVSVAVSYPGYYTFGGWDVNGTVKTSAVYTVAELGENTTFTLKLTEKPVYKVTLADISGKGAYTVTLPDGADQSGNVITCHENDALTIQVTPESGYTVTYWNVTAGDDAGSWETRASSLKYQFPTLTDNYTFTPVFAGTTYHTVTWPMIQYYDVTLTAQEGNLSTVSSGGSFSFTLSGGEDQYEYVLVNGLKFYDSAEMGGHYPYRYTDTDGVRVYTISNITADQEITVSMEAPSYGVNIDPASAQVPAGKTVTLKATSYGINTTVYTWSIYEGGNRTILQQSASDTFVYTAPMTPGETVKILLQAGNYDNGFQHAWVSNNVSITVTDSVKSIDVTAKELTPEADGSYLIHPITPTGTIGTYDFDALVTMIGGGTNADVTWSLWGAQMRGTSIDTSGVLTVSDKEYGTNGQLKVIATYTYANGDTAKEEVLINLSTDAYVATDVVNDLHGSIAEIGYVAGGTVVTVTAAPDENHAVASWYVDGVAVADNTSNTLTLTAEEMTHYQISVQFTHYYPEIKHDETNHWYECSCGDKIEVKEHYDFDKNHNCDKCDYVMSVCADDDKDHFCDWCGGRMTECADDVKDHICDWCGETLTICTDEDTDHVCDWCNATLGECADDNNNHFCDYCQKTLTECADDSRDHNCDICGRELSQCADGNDDHLCDWCGDTLTDCVDENKDHICDICGATGECADTDNDHNCDYCGKEGITECADTDSDHACDVCGDTLSECADTDSDHACDVCGEPLSECADTDSDHLCDICGEPLSECADTDSDHLCDTCGDTLSECADTDSDHNCDTCGDHLTACADEDSDNICDICGKELNVHDCADENRDHKCDTCGNPLSECADTEPEDHKCDICGKTLSQCADSEDDQDHACDICGTKLGECTDGDNDHNCDTCGEPVSVCADENRDHNCDVCGIPLSECADTDSDHACDVCGIPLSQCADTDSNHLCDTCGTVMSTCVDEADETTGLSDHLCDICGTTVSTCADEDKDHACDICGTVGSECADGDSDHNCDLCGKPVSECADEADAETGLSDHLCDICGDEISECEDKAGEDGFADHKCDVCGEVLTQCVDETDPADNLCDICGAQMHVCADEDSNHLCDTCGYKLTECVDELTDEDGNTDHICDICGDANSVCTDTDPEDHKCDICGEPVSECTDADDHLCDICGATVSECTDADHDDVCDICGEATFLHADGNSDHRCDVCALPLTECTDSNKDHLCDLCGIVWTVCVDKDKNHACEICGGPMGTHANSEGSHICEYCGKAASECADGNSDHNCDVCGEPVSECADTDSNHNCDTCGQPLSECADEADAETGLSDHLCDICGATLSQCADTDSDHNCDTCGQPVSECADETGDHICDTCGADMGDCKDDDQDHNCDMCGEPVSECADGDSDHNCDICNEPLSECTDGNDDHNCDICGSKMTESADKDKDHLCDICGETISACTDSNYDNICDICGTFLGECEDTDHDHLCDMCGKPLSVCADEDGDRVCDICGSVMNTVTRIFGANRFKTAFKVADELKRTMGVEMFDAVIIASGTNFADALSGSYLASVKNAPVLLTLGDTMNAELHAYIEENLVKGGTVYILGGNAAVPETLDVMMEGYNVVRLAGENRYETNLLILKEAGVAEGDEILVCTGANFADSLSASAVGKPILLVWNESGALTDSQKKFLSATSNSFCIIGGENTVSARLETAISAYGSTERLAGSSRHETSVLVAQRYFSESTAAVLSYAWNYPDGLCGGALAYSQGAPLILTDSNSFSYAESYVAEAGIHSGYVLGGPGLVGDEAVRTIFSMAEDDTILVK